METNYITVTGMGYYFGNEFAKPEMKVSLEKEPDNKHDREAIIVKLESLGKIGYVANSPHTVLGECVSAGRIYDKIGERAEAVVLYVVPQGIICKVEKCKL